MPLCNTTQTWVKNLNINGTHKQYVVQLKRQIQCCGFDKYQIFVNGEEIQHQLTDNPCSPLCCPGGRYEWETDGHFFLIMFNSLSFTTSFGKHRLFIDGLDCNTGREYSAFWRRRGWQCLILGVCMVLIGITISLLHHYLPRARYLRSTGWLMWIGYSCFLSGILFMVYCVILFLRYKHPLTYQNVVYETANNDLNQV